MSNVTLGRSPRRQSHLHVRTTHVRHLADDGHLAVRGGDDAQSSALFGGRFEAQPLRCTLHVSDDRTRIPGEPDARDGVGGGRAPGLGVVGLEDHLGVFRTQLGCERDGRFTRWVYDDFSLLFHDAFASGDADFWSSASGEDAFTRAHSLMRRVPERFDYAPAHRVALPFAAATFRGAGGRTDVAVHLGVPGEPPQAITAGAFLLGPDGTVVAESRRSVTRRTALPETVTLSARPGRYTLAAEFELGGAAVGFERAPLDVPDYTGRELALSDFVVAHHVEEAEAGETGGFVRRGHRIAPAVEPVFATSQPIYLYVEAYNLRVEGGRSRYAVEVSLEPEAPGGLAGLARRLLGADERGVAVEFEGEAPGADLGEYVILDASRRTPGPYLLTLRLRDRVSGEAIARTAKLFLE